MGKLLHGFQCKICGANSLIAYEYCANCREKESFQEVKFNGRGTIFSFTKIFVAEERFQSEIPYVVAVIHSDDGLRLLGRIEKEDMEKVTIGAMVELKEWKEDVAIFKVS
ncbi:Zn-ribbon domain-containing OB-fold protein [Cytobacillus sp. Hz8]|uniref:Zn-ribbon domain-containing OB-fold protein n=1 Tax=Cytobacillus sp. Hz8 TaxID=3347168 RepID=UPI0035DA33AA